MSPFNGVRTTPTTIFAKHVYPDASLLCKAMTQHWWCRCTTREAASVWSAGGAALGRAELNAVIAAHGPMLLAVGYYFNARYCLFSTDQPHDQQLPTLSSREVAVFEMASGGSSDEEIADCLGISFHTVRFHISNAVRKLGARNRVHAVALAAQVGIIGAVRALTPDLIRTQR